MFDGDFVFNVIDADTAEIFLVELDPKEEFPIEIEGDRIICHFKGYILGSVIDNVFNLYQINQYT
jgi:hypothetical protein